MLTKCKLPPPDWRAASLKVRCQGHDDRAIFSPLIIILQECCSHAVQVCHLTMFIVDKISPEDARIRPNCQPSDLIWSKTWIHTWRSRPWCLFFGITGTCRKHGGSLNLQKSHKKLCARSKDNLWILKTLKTRFNYWSYRQIFFKTAICWKQFVKHYSLRYFLKYFPQSA